MKIKIKILNHLKIKNENGGILAIFSIIIRIIILLRVLVLKKLLWILLYDNVKKINKEIIIYIIK